MVLVFFSLYNGVTFYYQSPLHKPIYFDVSLEGLGGCYDNSIYALQIPKCFGGCGSNVVVALKIWGLTCADKSIQIMCDNIAMVEVLTFGRTRDPIMATCARNIWLLVAMFNVNIVASHITGLDKTLWQTYCPGGTKLLIICKSCIT